MADDTQIFINNWGTTIEDAAISVGDTTINIPAADSAALGPIAANEYVAATGSNGSSLEVMWITDNDEAGELTVSRGKEGTSPLSYVSGNTIECYNTKGTYENFVQKDAPQTLTQKKLTDPIIQDENGNEQLKTATTTDAVNEITVKNAATGNGPQIQATGDDTNIDLNLVPKGTGEVKPSGPINLNGKTLKTSQGSDVASANNMTLGADGNFFDITGTTTINTIASKGVGTLVVLQFVGILQLTHSADLVLPTGANITTAPGDIAVFYEYASGDWRCVSYTRADGTPLVGVQQGDAINMDDALLTRPQLKGYSESPQTPASTSTTVLNVLNGNVISFTLTEATTISTSNTLADKAGSLTMLITAAAGSEYSITWPATWKWLGKAAPSNFAVGTEHMVVLKWFDGDDTSKFYASYVGEFGTA